MAEPPNIQGGFKVIEELFRKRQTVGLTPEESRALFSSMYTNVLPVLSRKRAVHGPGESKYRLALGLPESVEYYWQEFIVKIATNNSWPKTNADSWLGDVTYGIIAQYFDYFLRDARRNLRKHKEDPRPDAHFAGSDQSDLENCENITGLSILPSIAQDGADESSPSEKSAGASMPDGNVGHEEFSHSPYFSGETTESARRYVRAARQFLAETRHLIWISRLIEHFGEPQFLDGTTPAEKGHVALIYGVGAPAVANQVLATGITTPFGRQPNWANWVETTLGQWITVDCGIKSPWSDRRFLLAYEALCYINREDRLGRVSDYANFIAKAKSLLASSPEGWVPRFIMLRIEPILVDNRDPEPESNSAVAMSVSLMQLVEYAIRFGWIVGRADSFSTKRGAPWNQTILGRWILHCCQIVDPEAHSLRFVCALEALCAANRENREASHANA